jgi:hypothetical protein
MASFDDEAAEEKLRAETQQRRADTKSMMPLQLKHVMF